MSEVFPDQASVVGDSDTVTFARSVSPDNTEITITASNPVLASHDWTCATYALLARTHAAAGTPNSQYDSNCDCWYVLSPLDIFPVNIAYFDGFAPAPPVVS